jgi:predicted KAP-like P-loop ATPase
VPRFTVGIYGGWGTGKTTIMQMIQKHLDEEYKNDIKTIWFYAWRYENEEFSALVLFVRTIILHLEEYVQKLGSEGNQKKLQLKIWQTNLKKWEKQFYRVRRVMVISTVLTQTPQQSLYRQS